MLASASGEILGRVDYLELARRNRVPRLEKRCVVWHYRRANSQAMVLATGVVIACEQLKGSEVFELLGSLHIPRLDALCEGTLFLWLDRLAWLPITILLSLLCWLGKPCPPVHLEDAAEDTAPLHQLKLV